ncbi:sigma factor [Streptomyces spectabilis]|uniref:RNA polymerase sigma-70 region 2 domain-containing protein n=1 Tax=Streptomyces spectabilis TaxID=68270 RepID=A0A516RF78_STRST|nr:sigma factor [Streptomyces spectabilis]QDQ14304.1 hypothetical protein FH965_30125 [Streptomyces spectabilis]
MDALTVDTITAAQANDMTAMSEVIRAMEPKLGQIASRIGGASNRDEFMQVGRIALWEGIGRFTGGTVDNFTAFIYKTVEGAVQEAAREERVGGATGADRDAVKIFSACVKEANGDLDTAEKLTQTLPPKGRRLSEIRARAARMAWEGMASLDMPNSVGGESALTNLLVSDYGVPDDLISEQDRAAATRNAKIKMIRAVLDTMGDKQRYILKSTYGVDPVPCLGTGAEADTELAERLTTKASTVRVLRNQAHKSFANRYTRVTGITPCTCDRCNSYRKARGVSL